MYCCKSKGIVLKIGMALDGPPASGRDCIEFGNEIAATEGAVVAGRTAADRMFGAAAEADDNDDEVCLALSPAAAYDDDDDDAATTPPVAMLNNALKLCSPEFLGAKLDVPR